MHIVQDFAVDGGGGADGRRARKKVETYRRLVTVARELGLARGVEAVTVEEIAERADVSVRTFFNYFTSKDEAMVGLEPGTADRLRRELLARPADEPPLTALRAVLVPARDDDAAYRWALRVELVHRSPALRPRHLAALAEIEEALADALERRMALEAGDATARIVAGATMGALRCAVTHWETQRTASLPEAIDAAFALLEDGLALPALRPPTPQQRQQRRRRRAQRRRTTATGTATTDATTGRTGG
jgi:AcrR family transcriptional regulator